jgi:hypothetical protein
MRKSSSTLAGSGKRSAGILSSPVRESVTRRISRLLAGDTLAARDGLEGLYLFDQMADVDDALEAGVGAILVLALELGADIGDSIPSPASTLLFVTGYAPPVAAPPGD